MGETETEICLDKCEDETDHEKHSTCATEHQDKLPTPGNDKDTSPKDGCCHDDGSVDESASLVDPSVSAVQISNDAKTPLGPQVDHGWAWMVVIGCSLMHFLVGGFARSYGIVYMYLQDRFDSSAAITAWVGGAASAIRMLSSPIGTALSNRFSARSVVMVGGVLLGLSGLLSAFAPSTEYMFFSFSVLNGFGGALVYAPGIIMVGLYFDKYRSIAMGIATAGSGLGVFMLPPIMQQLFHQYGFFGAMLITGALMFNNIVSGALYRPISVPESHAENEDEKAELLPDKLTGVNTGSTGDQMEDDKSGEVKLRLIVLQTLKEGMSNSSKNLFVSNSSTLHSLKPKECSECEAEVTKCCDMSKLYKYLDLRLFHSPTFILYVTSLALVTLAYISGQMLVPVFALDQGITSDKSVWLLSVIGISDTIGRATSGFIFSVPVIRVHRRHYYNVCMFISGLTHFWFLLCREYIDFTVVCILHGLFTGVVVSQRAVICIDLMGVQNLSSSFGLTIFMQGTGVLIGPAIAGLIKDVTGSYYYSFMFTGMSAVLAAVLLFLEWLSIARHGQRRAGKQESGTNGNVSKIESVAVARVNVVVDDRSHDLFDSEIFSPISSQVDADCDENQSKLLPLVTDNDDLGEVKVKVILSPDDRNIFSEDVSV